MVPVSKSNGEVDPAVSVKNASDSFCLTGPTYYYTIYGLAVPAGIIIWLGCSPLSSVGSVYGGVNAGMVAGAVVD